MRGRRVLKSICLQILIALLCNFYLLDACLALDPVVAPLPLVGAEELLAQLPGAVLEVRVGLAAEGDVAPLMNRLGA